MSIFAVVLIIAVIGVLLYLVNRIPMAAPFKVLINVIVVFAAVLWLLSLIGVLGPLEAVRVPRLHR